MRPAYAKASDAELLEAADAEAFAALYDRHVDQLFAWARARVGDYAADLTAEVFARAWLCRTSFRDRAGGSAFPWLYGIAQNVLRDSLRRRRVEDRARRRLGLPRAVAADPAYEAVEGRLSLPEEALRAVAELPASDRELLDLRIVQERPYQEIAYVDASTTIDGVPAYKLSVSGASDRFLDGTAYVAQSDYYPLEIDTTGNGGERIVVERYEYLPATPANLALLR